jgi:hypothetical protein
MLRTKNMGRDAHATEVTWAGMPMPRDGGRRAAMSNGLERDVARIIAESHGQVNHSRWIGQRKPSESNPDSSLRAVLGCRP